MPRSTSGPRPSGRAPPSITTYALHRGPPGVQRREGRTGSCRRAGSSRAFHRRPHRRQTVLGRPRGGVRDDLDAAHDVVAGGTDLHRLGRDVDVGELLELVVHRGQPAAAYHPEIEGLENTLAAFKHAVALGYDYLETDVHVTRDGVLLAFHDAVLDRVTDARGDRRPTFDEVRAGAGRRPRAGADAGPALRRVPRARFNIDLKSDGRGAGARGVHRGARGLGPGAGRLVQPQRLAEFRRSPVPGARPRPPRSRSLSSASSPARGWPTG